MTKVTIGITAYNAADTLEEALNSALAQTHTNTEIVIVNDASTDGTATLLERLQAQHPAIKVIQQQTNRGVAAARNAIIAASTGDYIAFFDDDDTSAPTRVAEQLQAIKATEAAYGSSALVVCHTARTQVYPDGSQQYCATQVGNPIPRGPAVALRILVGKPLPHTAHGAMATCSQMASTAAYRRIMFDETLRRSEDTDFNIRLALAGGYFVGLAAPLVTQRMTLGQEKAWQAEHTFSLHVLNKYHDVVASAGFAGFAPAWATMKLSFMQGHYGPFLRQAARIAFFWPWQTVQRISWVLPNALDNLKIGRFRRGLNCL